MTAFEDVMEFHKVYGAPIAEVPTHKIETFDLRLALLLEEASEYVEARAREDFIEQVDALADLAYVTYGALLTHGSLPNRGGHFPSYLPRWATEEDATTTNFSQEIISYAKAVNLEALKNPPARKEGDNISLIENKLHKLLDAIYSVARGLDVDLDVVLKEVHRSNMSKLGANGLPIYRESDSKVLKGPNYSPPNIAKAIAESRYQKFFSSQPESVREWLPKFDIQSQKWYNDK